MGRIAIPNNQNPKSIPFIKRLGVLGGTFDPPHYGHLLLADTARVQLGLDRVLFAPAGRPPHKPEDEPSSVAHRVALVKAALSDANDERFVLSRVDVDRPGPHYTIDALKILRTRYPAAELWLLMGADSLNELPDWHLPVAIIEIARLAVLPRPGYCPDVAAIGELLELTQVSATIPNLEERVDWLMGPALDISSSALRKRVRAGWPLRYLVSPSVETYVQESRMYVSECSQHRARLGD